MTTLKEYVTKYSSALMLCSNMSPIDQLHRFLAGLKPWARDKVKETNPANLQEALNLVGCLVEYPARSAADSHKAKKVLEKKKKPYSPPVKDTKKVDGDKEDRACWSCGVVGHIASHCEAKKLKKQQKVEKSSYPVDRPSLTSGTVGDSAADCKQLQAKLENKKQEPKPCASSWMVYHPCWTCGEVGHFAADCRQANSQKPRQRPEQGVPDNSWTAFDMRLAESNLDNLKQIKSGTSAYNVYNLVEQDVDSSLYLA